MTFRRFILVLAFFTVLLTFSATAQAQRWSVWGTTPVFDGGRVMPLNTFSRQIVREICGTPRPFIVRDDSILVQLNRILETQPQQQQQEADIEKFPYLISGTDIFAGAATSYSEERPDIQDERSEANPVISGINRQRAEQLIQRIKGLVPQGGRYFDANELVLSWIGEPEIWDFIPIFQASETDFRTEILDIPLQNDIRTTLDRVSIYQLECSDRYQRRLADIDRRRQQRGVTEVPIPYDIIAERIARAMMAYQEFTFHPRRHRPDRMLELLDRSMDLSGPRESSFASAVDAWRHLLSVGAGPELQAIDPREAEADGSLTQLHPSTKRWLDISKRIQLLQRAFDRRDARGKPLPPNLKAVEQVFEMLIGMIDENLEESRALMERIYPGVEFRQGPKKTDPEKLLPLLFAGSGLERNREAVTRIVLTYHYSIGTLRREIEAAYLALYDNGRSLRVMPIGSALTLGGPENTALGMQPWGSMQMLLFGGDDFIRRFFDPRFQLDTTAPIDELEGEIPEELRISQALVVEPTLSAKETEEEIDEEMIALEEDTGETEDEKRDRALEKALFSDDPAADFATRSSASQPALGPVGKVRSHFQTLVASYSTLVREYANSRFNGAAADLQSALRETAGRSEPIRLQYVSADNPSTEEYLTKTVYPKEKAVNAEYRYYRLAPFFWMWVFAAGAVVLAGISLLIGQWRRNAIDATDLALHPESGQAEWGKFDAVKSPEETTLWIAIALLSASIAVTLIGGVMRALISGWAPVTNMYETVVLMAFSASLFGLWYSLYPWIHPAIQMAWRYTSFPAWHRLKFVMTPKPKAAAPTETDGEQAMRQAAEDFGLPGGMPIGTIPDATAEQTETDLAAQKETKTLFWQSTLFIPRVVLMLVTFVAVVYISYGEYAHEHGAFAAAAQMLKMSDFIDWLVVVASIAVITWFVPHLVLTALLFPVLLARPSAVAADLGIVSFVEKDTNQASSSRRSEMSSVFSGENVGLGGMVDVSGRRWLSFARNQILDRKLFVIIAAAVALLAGLAAHFNSTEFNPDIRPIVAVLRSNFWLTVHVIAIIVSYAAAMIAWGMAVVALGDAIFGRYRYSERPGGQTLIQLPPMSEMFAPIIHKLIQVALLLLVIGTVLGARWADYSWGRFWSWDPKEVWALITILFFAVVLHGRIARFYGRIGVVVGALLGSIAVIVTWYGINFVFKGSVHSYGGGASSHATIFMAAFIILNLLWGCLALFRYSAVMYGRDTDE